MDQQRTRAREARQSSQSMQIQSEVLKNITTESKFVGYETTDYQTTLTDLIYNGEKVESVEPGETVYFILKETPFYAVSGGQVADKGTVGNENFEIEVTEVTKAPNGQNLHQGVIQFGQVTINSDVDASVNRDERKDIQKS